MEKAIMSGDIGLEELSPQLQGLITSDIQADEIVETDNKQFISKTEKDKIAKIDGLSNHAVNKTIHITAEERTNWNAKASTTTASTTQNGLMSKEDKSKLDGVATGANKYVHPSTHPASIITQDSSNRFVTDAEKATWNGKASTSVASTTANGLMSKEDKAKLNGIATGATNYVHPNDTNTRHVTDTEKATWNAKASTAVATGSVNGLMSSADKTKLDGIATGANRYVHPNDAGTRHVTDAEKTAWNNKASTAVVTTTANGLMSKEDKTKLNGIATGANNYAHPTTSGNKHIPSGGASGQILRWSADGTAVWGADNNTTYGVVSKTANGLAPQLPNETTTTKYLRQDGTWAVPPNTTYGVASTTANGLMSSGDKTKLDGIATGANNYVHPTSDGNKHIPANGTTNSGKFLQATATAGTYQWATLPTATTETAGMVQLIDSYASTSTTQAPTASSVKRLYDGVKMSTGTPKYSNGWSDYGFGNLSGGDKPLEFYQQGAMGAIAGCLRVGTITKGTQVASVTKRYYPSSRDVVFPVFAYCSYDFKAVGSFRLSKSGTLYVEDAGTMSSINTDSAYVIINAIYHVRG